MRRVILNISRRVLLIKVTPLLLALFLTSTLLGFFGLTGSLKAMETLPAEIVKTAEETEFTVIWMHGLGADGNDFVPVIPELRLPASLKVKFIFPHAPSRPVTLNNGMSMPAWYDLLSLDRSKNAHEDDILTTVTWINKLIDDEIESGTPSEKILLAGFSQGGVIALHTGLRYPKKLAGIMALSTYIPFAENLLGSMQEVQKGISIFAAHGQQDPVIPFASWQDYVPQLEAKGFDVDAHAYQMEHSVNMEEINDISSWLQKTLSIN
ncbi:Carboxylesterase 1 [Nymphon striatum]|nr:Carboxylesterase 1 [Nymphon striatum]